MNVPSYAKGLVAVLGAIAASLAVVISDGVIDPAEWVTVAVAVLTALGVWAVPNRPE